MTSNSSVKLDSMSSMRCVEEEKKEDDKIRTSSMVDAPLLRNETCDKPANNLKVSITPLEASLSDSSDFSTNFSPSGDVDTLPRDTGLTPMLAGLTTSSNSLKSISPLTSALLGGTPKLASPPSENFGSGVMMSISSIDEERRKQLQMTYLAGFRAAVEMTQNQQAIKQTNMKSLPDQNFSKIGVDVLSDEVVASTQRDRRDNDISEIPSHFPSESNSENTRDSSPQLLAKSYCSNLRRSASMSGLSLAQSTCSNANSNNNKLSSTASSSNAVSNPFPRKLMEMLSTENVAILSWLPRGDAFVVRDTEAFIEKILPKYFRHTKVCFYQDI